jgi:plastocyanin
MATPTLERGPGRVRPRYARTGLLGLGLITGTLLVFLALILTLFPEEVAFVLPMVAVAAVATGLVWKFDATWSRIVGAVATVGLAAMLFWVVFGLAHPASFFDFVPAVAFLVGVGLSLFGNIAAIVQRRRQHLDAKAGSTERRVEQVAVGVVVLAVLVSGVLSVLGRSSVDEAVAADAVAVDMANFAFEPPSIEASSGQQLLVHNSDPFVHDIAVPELGIEAVTVPPGSDVLVDVPATAGTYVVYCTLHSNTDDADPDPEDQMVTSLTVR